MSNTADQASRQKLADPTQQRATTKNIRVPGHTKPAEKTDTADDSVLTTVPQTAKATATERLKFPNNLPSELQLFLAQDGRAAIVTHDHGNPSAHFLNSRKGKGIIRCLAQREGIALRKSDINDVVDYLQSAAEMAGKVRNAFYRVAPIDGGIEIDLGDEKQTRVQITASQVRIVEKGSTTLFYRSPVSKPFVTPADHGDLNRLKKYLNLRDVDVMLIIAWLSYTLAHPKVAATSYVFLVLHGDQGSGKTWLTKNIILPLIDPNSVGVRTLTGNEKDLAIGSQNAHVLAFDNVRGFKPALADSLCRASTGGSLSSRQLYTDADEYVQHMHVALVLNGIHSFVTQPDLAQRCLPIHMKRLSNTRRQSEGDLVRELEVDLPLILRGLLELIAGILEHLPSIEVAHPERMVDYSRWLAAYEKVDGVPAGTYQSAYSFTLREAQLDGLQDSPLAAAMLEFARQLDDGEWSDTPAKLLAKLNLLESSGDQRSSYWPQNPSALSRRLVPLQAALREQGVAVEFHRGKVRKIDVTVLEGFRHD